jgi:hypothetical protein
MNALTKIKAAQAAAQAIIASFREGIDNAPDVVEARKQAIMLELEGMKNGEKIDHLIAKIVELEKPVSTSKVKVEDVAKALMESTACATLTWGDVADLIQTSGLGDKTSAASISSYASKRKADWNIVPREKLSFRAADLLAASQLEEPAQLSVVNG